MKASMGNVNQSKKCGGGGCLPVSITKGHMEIETKISAKRVKELELRSTHKRLEYHR